MIDAFLIKPALRKSAKQMARIESLKTKDSVELIGSDYDQVKKEIDNLRTRDEVRVVACGGDGTMHWAINSAHGLDVSLAVVPMGTGNDFARALDIRSFDQGRSVLQHGQSQRIDVGKISLGDGDSRFFVGVASCGFDAQVNERANGYPGPQGTAKYVAAIFGELKALKAIDLDLEVDGQRSSGKFSLVAVANSRSYGGGMKICPTAEIDDGIFDVTYVDEVRRRTLVRVLPRVFNGSHVSHPKVSVDRITKISISGEPFPVYADGERVGVGPATIELVPASARVWRANSSSAT